MKKKGSTVLTGRDFELADARHVAAGLARHFDVLKLAGLKESELRDFNAVIADAVRHNAVETIAAQVMYEQARLDVRERLGEFRRWSGVVARLPTGIDAAAWKALKLSVDFPNDDKQLALFMKDLAPGMKKYSARLAARSFGKEKQQGLLDAYAEMVKLGKQVVAEKAARKTGASDRASAFGTLRSYTRHYRELGLAAFHGSVGEGDFRRVHKAKRPAASPPAGEEGEAAAPKRKSRKAQRAEEKAKKAQAKEGQGSGAGSGAAAASSGAP